MSELQRNVDALMHRLDRMGLHVQQTVLDALDAVDARNVRAGQAVSDQDSAIDADEVAVEKECIRLLALYQPTAVDLRSLCFVIKANNDLERIADKAASIGRRGRHLVDDDVDLATYPEWRDLMVLVTERLDQTLRAISSRNLQAAENIQRQMDMDFPGNTVGGAFSRSEHVSFALADFLMGALDARHRPVPVGRAKTVTTDGAIRGRSAPKFIANIFPGLNLTTYRYEKMIAFAELLPSGTARNDMLFDGIGYDIYIEGDTDKDRIGRYTTGVLLLPTKTSPESLHGLKQGRIPILKFKARIEDGQFHDQQVWYPLPTETAFTIFLKNNLLFRLWTVAFQKKGAAVIAPTKTTGNGKATPAPRGP